MPDDAATPEEQDLSTLERPQLDAEAERLGIDADPDRSDDDLIAAIEERRAQDGAPDGGEASAPSDAAPPADDAETADGDGADAPDGDGDAAAEDGGMAADVAEVVGPNAARLVPFGRTAAEVLAVALESALSHRARIDDVSVVATEYAAMEGEFSDRDHVAFELRVALGETEAYLTAVLVPLDDLGALFMVDTSAEQMADDEFAATQIETVSTGTRELLDLISLTLFADGLAGAEATLSETRRGQIELTLGMLADVAQGVTPVRVDFSVVFPDATTSRVTVVIPADLLTRIADLSADGAARTAAAAPATAAPTAAPPPEQPGFGLSDAGLNVTPLRPGDGRPSGPDAGDGEVPVHPVRFPPLGESQATGAGAGSIDMLMDVPMRITVELGRSSMTVEEILALGPGSVVELNKLAGEPVDILVNDRLIARGEVVVVDENFGVRVTEIVSPRNRAHAMGR